MSYLSDEELDNLRVVRMIIHVVGQRDGDFAPQPEIEVQQEGFFRARIVSEASDGVHSFVDGSPVRMVLERMAREEIGFEAGGQELARRFGTCTSARVSAAPFSSSSSGPTRLTCASTR